MQEKIAAVEEIAFINSSSNSITRPIWMSQLDKTKKELLMKTMECEQKRDLALEDRLEAEFKFTFQQVQEFCDWYFSPVTILVLRIFFLFPSS